MKQKFKVTGMTCSACSAHVEKAVRKLPDVSSVAVDLLGGSMQVEFDDSKLSNEQIIAAVVDAGYGASLPAAPGNKTATTPVNTMEEELKSMKHRFIASLCFLLPLFYLSMGHMMGWPDALRNSVQAFYSSILDGSYRNESVPYCTFKDGFQGMAFVEAFVRSSRERRWVEVEQL